MTAPVATDRPDLVRTLGRFEVVLRGRTIVRWRAGRALQLFQYLLANAGQPVSKPTLIDAIWGESAGRSPEVSLKVAVCMLRSLMAEALAADPPGTAPAVRIVTIGASYALETSGLWVDTDEFERTAAAAQECSRRGLPQQALRHWLRATQLYTGPYLPDCRQPWAAIRRERLTDLELTALSALADDAQRRGDRASQLDLHQRLLDIDPCREASYRELMRYHAVARQPLRVQQWYLTCVQQLSSRLGVEPDHNTRLVFYQAVTGQLVTS